MTRKILAVALLTGAALLGSAPAADAEFGIGADVYNRYFFRGADFGDAVAVQPYISYTQGAIEIGAWSSWSITSADGGNENDLYVTYSAGPLALTLTDYYFPSYLSQYSHGGLAHREDVLVITAATDTTLATIQNPVREDEDPSAGFLDYGSEGAHILEIMASYDLGSLSIMGAFNFHGDEDDSFYVELGLPLAALSDDETEVSLSAALGNGAYVAGDDPALVFIGINVSQGDYSASYIVNPDSELSFLVFGKSL
jgi:hypothetical protein